MFRFCIQLEFGDADLSGRLVFLFCSRTQRTKRQSDLAVVNLYYPKPWEQVCLGARCGEARQKRKGQTYFLDNAGKSLIDFAIFGKGLARVTLTGARAQGAQLWLCMRVAGRLPCICNEIVAPSM